MMYGTECWPTRKADTQKLHVAEMNMLRWPGGVTCLDKVRNEYIRGSFKVADISLKLRENRLRWYGHVMRRDEDHTYNQKSNGHRRGQKRKRPPAHYMD